MQSKDKLDSLLESLQGSDKAAMDADMGGKDTQHPSAQEDNGTVTGNLEGARSTENEKDNKDEQAAGVGTAGDPPTEPEAGSMGVQATSADQSPPGGTGDTSGVSEQLDKDTAHPSANGEKRGAASELLLKMAGVLEKLTENAGAGEGANDGAAGKEASDNDKDGAAGKEASDNGQDDALFTKQAAELKKLASEHPAMVTNAYKFAEHVLGAVVKQADDAFAMYTALKQANDNQTIKISNASLGEMGLPAEEIPEEGALGEEELLGALVQLMQAQGITPEELDAYLASGAGAEGAPMEGAPMEGAPTEGAPAPELGDAQQMAALEAALAESGAPTEVPDDGLKVGSLQFEPGIKPGVEKFAAEISKNPGAAEQMVALKNQYLSEIKAASEKGEK